METRDFAVRSSMLCICLSWLALSGLCCLGEEPSAPKATPETAPPTASSSVSATSLQDLRTRVGQELVISGDVTRIGTSATGHRFINFAGNPELSVFISSEDVSKFQPDTPEKLYAGKSIEVSGKLERFNDKLQVRVRSPDAIKFIEKPRGPPDQGKPPRPAPVELKSTGKDRWISPAGLKYEGRDPDGKTRKEHVLRHARDIPNRDGPHGVFDGGEELAFAWIDAAWEKIQKQKIRPRTEDGRDVYTVNMGQRVGYMGGEFGGRAGHPALDRIFLVLRQGTTEVVTAFPK
ncbi:hypothetical protein SH661x_001110 [Planctomicrobium sp. SH661]|uniref:hypothetical protein n=1 Tax=Planctomicrobium sp. SH661 TaxID=3448124 RepID=UPI003F5B0D9D